jgi:hypothetical protein
MFRRLLRAREPVVRVAGAVYLTYEDSSDGLRALREFSRLEGFPGAWASTVLASQGDRLAAREALKVFDLPSSYENHHHIAAMQARVLVLLSNSAQTSGVKQPPTSPALFSPRSPSHKDAVKALRKWWKSTEAAIHLHDPWLLQFSRQKVD